MTGHLTPETAPRAWDLIEIAARRGSAVAWKPGTDNGGAPYVQVQVVHDGVEHRATWHTRRRDGSQRNPALFSAMTRWHAKPGRPARDWHDTTVKAITAHIRGDQP